MPSRAPDYALPLETERELSVQERAFVDAYLIDNGRSLVTIEKNAGLPPGAAGRMLADPSVKAVIVREVEARTARARLKADQVDEMLHDIVLLDVADLVDKENRLKPIHQIPAAARRAIASLDLVVHEGIVVGVKPVPASKMKALELVMRRLDMIDGKKDRDTGVTNATYINVNYGDGVAVTRGTARPVLEHDLPARDTALAAEEFERAIGVRA